MIEQVQKDLESLGRKASKELGQNFLVDEETLEKIVGAADLKKDDLVIEVGPGLGVLTRELTERAGEVIAIEKDPELTTFLKNKSELKKVDIREGDILNTNIQELVGDREYKVVANIPYYITGKILRLFLEAENKPKKMVLLTQKEVAERICAKPGEMSILAVTVQLFADPKIVSEVQKESFFPIPEVDSAILELNIKKKEEIDEKEYFRVVKIGFSGKRKMIKKNLSAGLHLDKNEVEKRLKDMGIDPFLRAEDLNLDNWKEIMIEFGAHS